MLQEWADRHMPLRQYARIATAAEQNEFDDLHDEVPDYSKVFEDAVNLRSYFVPAEQMHPLTIFGIEVVREMMLYADVWSLRDAGLATVDGTTKEVTLLMNPGDRFEYSRSTVYQIDEWKIGYTWANTDLPLFFIGTATRVRAEARKSEIPGIDLV